MDKLIQLEIAQNPLVPAAAFAWNQTRSGKEEANNLIKIGLRKDFSAPATLISATSTETDLLANAVILNRGEARILGYRVGWLITSRNKEPQIFVGEWMNVPVGISQNQSVEVPSQAIDLSAAVRSKVTGVQFFVGELRLENGRVWKDDLLEEKVK